MVSVLVLSLTAWYFTRDKLPDQIRIATGAPGGQYHEFGRLLKSIIEQRGSMLVELVPTAGSVENGRRLAAGEVDFALIQGGAVDLEGSAVVAPLFYDVLHVVVRADAKIRDLNGLAGHRVLLGAQGSGMRTSAVALLSRHGLLETVEEANASYFAALPGDKSIDGAVITCGIQNPDLRRILSSGDYELLAITDAAAIEMTDPYYQTLEIPRGLYREEPAVPSQTVTTLATTAFLLGNRSTSDTLVAEVLTAIHEEGLRLKMPTLLKKDAARQWLDMPMHPAARRYFDPQDEVGHMASIMESLAATKELLFALAAGIYLLWERWRRMQEKEKQAKFNEQKERLDELLSRTVAIESQQMGITDTKVLRQMLDEVTRIKIQALEELTHEQLRGDRIFLIFLTQCSSLIAKIQAKLRPRDSLVDVVGQVAMVGGLLLVAAIGLFGRSSSDLGGDEKISGAT